MSRMVAHMSNELQKIKEGKMVEDTAEREREVKVREGDLSPREGEEDVGDEGAKHVRSSSNHSHSSQVPKASVSFSVCIQA